MNLDTVAVNIRPRNPWEAIDIGFVLARRWYWKLWLLWLLAALPSLILLTGLSLLLPGSTPKWTLVLFWLFKPFYEPSLLSWVSRALFGGQGTIRSTLKDVRKNLPFRRIWTILINRFSPFRSFSLPVLLLEGLEGKERKNRLILLKDGSETAALLTGVGFCIETVLAISLMSILYWFIPEELRWVDLGDFIFTPDNWILLLSYIIGCSIFAPFYICSGFMMYISRRVELEAWDIEIGFKRIRQRLQKRKNVVVRTASSLILLLLLSLSLTSQPKNCQAASTEPETARETISTILEQNDFGKKVTKYRWVPKEKETPDSDSALADFWQQLFETLAEFLEKLAPLLAKYGEFLLWCCAGVVIAFLLLKYSRLRGWLGNRFTSPKTNYTPPAVMFGMDLRPESLPEDIGDVCAQLLEKGKKREAMSLLYRGTLSGLVNSYRLEIHSSFTENECCDKVQASRPEPEATFFSDLTSLWTFIAYGHRDPDTGLCRELTVRWQDLYGVQSLPGVQS